MVTYMNTQKKIGEQEGEQQDKTEAVTIEWLEILLQKAERIHKDVGELIAELDQVCIELKATGKPSWDFLAKGKRPANNID
jgi:hypothetical protein